MYFFVSSLRPCMRHTHGVISGRHTSTDSAWSITLFAELCTTCRGEWVLLVIRFNVTFLPLRSYCEKNLYLFLEKSPTMHGCAFWWSLIVFLYRYSPLFLEQFNRILLCGWVPGGYSVSWGRVHRAGHKAFVCHQDLARVGLFTVTCGFRILL